MGFSVKWDIPRFLAAARNSPYFVVFCTALLTGLRLGELLAPRWGDLALAHGSLSVVRALYKRSGVCEFKEPKSRGSRRRISLPASLVQILQDHRLAQEAQGVLLGRPLAETDLVFGRPGNKPFDP